MGWWREGNFYTNTLHGTVWQARLRSGESGSLRCLRIPNGSDLQRELCALMFFSEDYWSHQSGLGPLDLRLVIREGDVELSDESHQERLNLDHPVKRVSRARRIIRKITNARDSPPDATPDASGERSAGWMRGQYPTAPLEPLVRPYRLPYIPTGDSTCPSISNQRSGRNTYASGPHKSWFLSQRITWEIYRGSGSSYVKETYKLYPTVEMVIGVPLGMGNSVYTLPEIPTIDFVRGITSSCIGVRTTVTVMGLILKVSYTRN